MIKKDGSQEYITLNNGKYFLTPFSDDTFKVKGQCIKGMIQTQIQNIFTHSSNSKDLYITAPSLERDNFFARIDITAFIESFILTILIRPQDGKIINLEQSNVLFQAIENSETKSNPLDPQIKLNYTHNTN